MGKLELTYVFSKMIICPTCKRRFKGKIENGKRIYIDSTWSNYGKDKCTRKRIDENELIEKVNKHIEITKINARREGRGEIELTIQSFVDHIERDDYSYTIFYIDGSKTMVKDGHIIY